MSDSEQAFQEARSAWRAALREHVNAPPDAGFSARIAHLAAAAAAAARRGMRRRIQGWLRVAGDERGSEAAL
jgi:hypothetical protein